jgi:xanthine dehydrogenase accessory factor
MSVYKQVVELEEAGRPFVLATIVRKAGSSPRKAGARMLVFPDGSISGTIGGGKFETMVIEDSLGLFEGGPPHLLKKYKFTGSGEDSTGMSCGGEADVFMELHGRPERLVIFGGGHVGNALCGVCRNLGFRITVVDDRDEILKQYPSSVERVLADDEYNGNLPVLDESCYAVIVTRSHKCDTLVLEHVLRHNTAYIGMIGSKNKVANVISSLKEKGAEKEKLDVVHAPIGLDIGAEGPEEIAVSIAAELIAARRKTGK